MIFQRFHFESIARFLLRFPRWMGENPFVGFFILLFLALSISSLVFYQYVFVGRNADVGDELVEVRFDQSGFREIIRMWQERSEKFKKIGEKPVRNIFASPQPVEVD